MFKARRLIDSETSSSITPSQQLVGSYGFVQLDYDHYEAVIFLRDSKTSEIFKHTLKFPLSGRRVSSREAIFAHLSASFALQSLRKLKDFSWAHSQPGMVSTLCGLPNMCHL